MMIALPSRSVDLGVIQALIENNNVLRKTVIELASNGKSNGVAILRVQKD
jgi:hypothetical protein